MLELKNVSASYGKNTVLENIDLVFENGLYALIGPNGVGKTTLMSVLSTLKPCDSGEILYNSENIISLGKEYRKILGFLPQEFEPYGDMNAADYLKYVAVCKNLEKDEYLKQSQQLIEFVGLDYCKKKKTKTYSAGMKKRLGLAQALLGNPEILLLDEPTAGLDPTEANILKQMLSDYSENRTVIMSTHIISDIDETANKVVMLKDKKIIKNGEPEALLKELDGKVFSVKTEKQELPSNCILVSKKKADKCCIFRYIDFEDEFEKDSRTSCVPTLKDYFSYIYEQTQL